MKRRAVAGIFLTLQLIGVLALAFNIRIVKASGTITIEANGIIDPPGVPISTSDNVTYTIEDYINESIVVQRSNIIVDGAGYLVEGNGTGRGFSLQNVSNVTIKNTSIKGFASGIYLKSSSDSMISGNNITNNRIGIELDGSSNNSISQNNIAANNFYGVDLYSSSNYNRISGNNITTNNHDGIILYESSNNDIFWNNITTNGFDGIEFDESSNFNSIFENYIKSNRIGIYLDYSSNYNRISRNNVSNNAVGIELGESSNNTFAHNNFFANTEQVDIFRSGYANSWDEGYPSGGNYWSEYSTRYPSVADEYSGETQDIPGGDGIWDSPYNINAVNQDNYPLFELYSSPPLYTLTVLSSPVEVTFSADAIQSTSPWSATYTEGTSVDLVMPETHDGYVWSQWVEDGSVNRNRAVIMDKNIALTALFTADHEPPIVSLLFPQNRTYAGNNVSLFFFVSKPTSWIGYSLNNHVNVTVQDNTTIADLSDGIYSITVYANDTIGNMGYSDTVYFTIQTSVINAIPPTVIILSPENTTYATANIQLTAIADEPVLWMAYSLDNSANVTFSGNTNLSRLSDGSHYLVVYAQGLSGNPGVSDTVYFIIEAQKEEAQQVEPFLTWIVAVLMIIAVSGIAVYFLRIRKKNYSDKNCAGL